MDGRVARGERNREAVIDAALELTAELGVFPTAGAVATRAGVSTRSLFNLFPDLPSLFIAAAETQGRRHWSLLQAPKPSLDLQARVADAVAQRVELFEHISPVRRVAVAHEHEWPVLAERMQESRAALRRHLRRALSPEIQSVDKATVSALEAGASWEFWDLLRNHHGLSAAVSTAAVVSLLTFTLDGALAAS